MYGAVRNPVPCYRQKKKRRQINQDICPEQFCTFFNPSYGGCSDAVERRAFVLLLIYGKRIAVEFKLELEKLKIDTGYQFRRRG